MMVRRVVSSIVVLGLVIGGLAWASGVSAFPGAPGAGGPGGEAGQDGGAGQPGEGAAGGGGWAETEGTQSTTPRASAGWVESAVTAETAAMPRPWQPSVLRTPPMVSAEVAASVAWAEVRAEPTEKTEKTVPTAEPGGRGVG